MNNSPNILISDSPEESAETAAERFVTSAREAVKLRGRFGVALAGGNTPKRVYELLASEPYTTRIAWPNVHLFFGDERCVPPDDPDSNYLMVKTSLLDRAPIPAANVHRITGEGNPPTSAGLYEDDLRAFFPGSPWPKFDLVLLGMGEDGHTASLFPGSSATKEQKAWVAATFVEKLGVFRITLTAPAINHARRIVFLVAGETKAQRLVQVVSGPRDPERLAAQLIQPVEGSLEWLVDRAAASQLRM